MTSQLPPQAEATRFRAMLGLSFFIMFGYGLIVPVLPLFASKFGVREAGVGLVLTVFALTRLAGDLFAGGLIDRHGERLMAAIGAVIVGASSAAAGAAPNYPALVALRGFGGVGSAFFLGALMSSVIGSAPPERRGHAIGLYQGSIGMGFILGPVFGGIVAAIAGLRAPLFAYGAICLVGAPIAYAVLGKDVPSEVLEDAPTMGEDPPPAPARPSWRKLKPLLSDSAYLAALAGGASTFFLSGGLDTLVSRFWRFSLGQSEKSVGLPFAMFGLMGIAGLVHAGKLSDRRGRKFATVPALAVMAASVAFAGLAGSVVAFLAILAVLGVASSYQRPGPSAMVADVAPRASRGVAVAGFRFANDLGALVGPIVVGIVAQWWGREAGFIVIGAALGLAAVGTALARESMRPS